MRANEGTRPLGRRARRASLPATILIAGFTCVALAACGNSTAGLIPGNLASSLKRDFEAVAQAAQTGNGSCAKTEAQLQQLNTDFGALPAGLKGALRTRLQEGIANLHQQALAKCAQLSSTTTTTSTRTTTTQAPIVVTTTSAAPPPATTAPETPSTPSENSHGGAEAPESSGEGGAEAGGGPGEPEVGGGRGGAGGR